MHNVASRFLDAFLGSWLVVGVESLEILLVQVQELPCHLKLELVLVGSFVGIDLVQDLLLDQIDGVVSDHIFVFWKLL